MFKKLFNFISKTNGESHCFNQRPYIQKNNWMSNNPRDLTGAWTGSFTDPKTNQRIYGLNGVCLGLCAAYLIKGQNWSAFKQYVDTPECHRLTLGIMNYQEQYCDVTQAQNRAAALAKTQIPVKQNKSLFSRFTHKKKAEVQKNITYLSSSEAFSHIVKVQGGINFIDKVRLNPIKNTIERIDVLMAHIASNYNYKINMHRPGGGHAVAITTRRKRIKFFDPNQGEFSYPDTAEGREYFKVALALLFEDRYPEHNEFSIYRYTC
jgi:hypothetical protein